MGRDVQVVEEERVGVLFYYISCDFFVFIANAAQP